MNRTAINYIIELIMGLTFMILAITGILKWPGLAQNYGISFDISRWMLINTVHHFAGLILIVMVFFHLIMHWRFIYTMTKYYLFGEENVWQN